MAGSCDFRAFLVTYRPTSHIACKCRASSNVAIDLIDVSYSCHANSIELIEAFVPRSNELCALRHGSFSPSNVILAYTSARIAKAESTCTYEHAYNESAATIGGHCCRRLVNRARQSASSRHAAQNGYPTALRTRCCGRALARLKRLARPTSASRRNCQSFRSITKKLLEGFTVVCGSICLATRHMAAW